MACPVCLNSCQSLNDCNKKQEWLQILEDAKKLTHLKKWIKTCVPHFKGNSKWLTTDRSTEYKSKLFSITSSGPAPDSTDVWKYRFLTITFDPKKFSFNEMTQPDKLHNYTLNALLELKVLFDGNIILIREYHKSGVPHYHLNYTPVSSDAIQHIILRLKYYFAATLNNKHSIHDRIFNAGGYQYITKSTNSYWSFEKTSIPPENSLEIII